ncbi:MAG: DUF1330 domain-containing protein [Pseudolabrys sp.]
MPKDYLVVSYHSLKNPDALQAYAKLAGPAIHAAGGRFLVRGMPPWKRASTNARW